MNKQKTDGVAPMVADHANGNNGSDASAATAHGLLARLMFRKGGGLTWFGCVALATIAAFLPAAGLMGGCMNIYVRCPGHPKIDRVYQSTSDMAYLTVVASFPQMMSPQGSSGIMWENCLSVPFMGLPCAVDTALEAVVDTVCLPYDYPVSISRKDNQ